MYIGAAYYPEFYSKDKWETDAKLMEKARFNVVRMAEFAWCKLEPKEGEFYFEWLDEIIELMASHGMKTVLGTPSGAPPQWLYSKYPDILPVEYNRYKREIGCFGNYCMNNKDFLRHVSIIVTKLAEHYKDNDNVILYQIDNELPQDDCYCDSCLSEFKNYLKKEHKTIENYNENLMTVFQGRELSSFDEVYFPLKSRESRPPALVSEYKKFMSETQINFAKLQYEIIHSIDDKKPVTTNYDSTYTGFDHFKMSNMLDLPSFDVYPKADSVEDLETVSFLIDFTRSTAKDKTDFWMLEQQCSPCAFKKRNYTLIPGEEMLYTYHSIARGVNNIVYFRFNSTHNGYERFGAGMLRHDNQPGRIYNEVCKITDSLEKVKPYLENTIVKKAEVAILYSCLSDFTLNTPNAVSDEIDYQAEVKRIYHYFYKNNISVDFVEPCEDISSYKIVIAPMFAAMRECDAVWLNDYVKEGGTLLATPLIGLFDEYNNITTNFYIGNVRDLFGVKVNDWYTPYENFENAVEYNNKKYDSRRLSVFLESEGAEILGEYLTEFYAGTTAISKNSFGKGQAYYLGVLGNEILFADILDELIREKCVSTRNVRGNADICVRENEEREIVFVFNPSIEMKFIEIKGQYKNVLTNSIVEGKLEISSRSTLILTNQI